MGKGTSWLRRNFGFNAPRERKSAQRVQHGDLVFVRAECQAKASGVGFPERVFMGFVAQTFGDRPYVNVVCANTQYGPAWFKANSVSPVGETNQTDNIFALTEDEL